jgi:outer membrane biogenesis lipoprotein LolB
MKRLVVALLAELLLSACNRAPRSAARSHASSRAPLFLALIPD